MTENLDFIDNNDKFLCENLQGLGLTIGAAFMDVKKASTLASVIIMTSMLSGGFFIQVWFLLIA